MRHVGSAVSKEKLEEYLVVDWIPVIITPSNIDFVTIASTGNALILEICTNTSDHAAGGAFTNSWYLQWE